MCVGTVDPDFLSPEGEQAWTWLRRHLDRANAFWLGFILTDDLTAQRVLRERVRANRRQHTQPLTVLTPATPDELANLLDELEQRGAAPPGCTWVAAPQLADEEWLAAWRRFLLAMNHRRDVLRTRLGGLVIAAPPAVKPVAQRESPDLWSVRDLLVELTARRVVPDRAAVPRDRNEPRRTYSSQGLSYETADAELAEEAQVLLTMPVAELAGPARERASRAVHRARAQGEQQLAAVLLLAQSDGYDAAGDTAGALHLVQEALSLDAVELRTRERLVGSGVVLAMTLSELTLAREYANEWVALTKQLSATGDPEPLHDLAFSLEWLGYVIHELSDPTTARTHHQAAHDIRRRLADQLDTPQAHRDLARSLARLGDVTRDLGDSSTAQTHYQAAHDIDRRLADQLDTPQAHRNLSASLERLGDSARDLGDLITARIHHQAALNIDRRLASELGTARALQDLQAGLNDLAETEKTLGNLDTAATLRAESATVSDRLAALSRDSSDDSGPAGPPDGNDR